MPTLGTCGACGGAVTVPDIWFGIHPPPPTCSSCGRHPVAPHGPVMPMAEPKQTSPYPIPGSTGDYRKIESGSTSTSDYFDWLRNLTLWN